MARCQLDADRQSGFRNVTGTASAGTPTKFTAVVKISLRYICSGSAIRSPILNADDAETGSNTFGCFALFLVFQLYVLFPVSASSAFKIGERISDPLQMYLNDIFTTAVNLVGVPGIAVPVAYRKKECRSACN